MYVLKSTAHLKKQKLNLYMLLRMCSLVMSPFSRDFIKTEID